MPPKRANKSGTKVGKGKRGGAAYQKAKAKAAYKPKNKKAMVKARAPFVETKSRTHEDVLVDFPSIAQRNQFQVYNTQHLSLNPDSLLAQQQGLEETQMLGRSLFCRFLKMKISVRFPQPAFSVGGTPQQIPQVPQRYYLVWGFVNATNWTGNTTPKVNTATIDDVHSWVNQRVVDYFNEQKDFLRFIPKKMSTLTIIGKRKVYPSKKYLTAVNSHDNVGADTITGVIPDFNTSISWPMMKKYSYEKSSGLSGGTAGFYPNYNRLPFALLVNPDWEDLPSGPARIYQVPQVAYNDCLWYTDS